MSLSSAFQGRFSAHVGFLFTELPLPGRFTAARAAGFQAVEHPNLFDLPASKVRQCLSDTGLAFVQTSFPAGDPARGEKGFAALPDQVERFRRNVLPTLDYAAEIGCGLVHAMAAVRPPGASDARLIEVYMENLAYAADLAAARGISLIVEPIGPGSVANYLIDAPQTALDIIVALGRRNVGLLFDVYHAVVLGYDPVPLITSNGTQIKHVQIADHPGRHEPGSGTIDFAPVAAALQAVGYEGYIGCEYHPAASTLGGLGWMSSTGPALDGAASSGAGR